jgi:hypothetical protein
MQDPVKLELGVCFNLYQRLNLQEDARSIGLAKRSFLRSKLKLDKLQGLIESDLYCKIEQYLQSIVKMQESNDIDVKSFSLTFSKLINTLEKND